MIKFNTTKEEKVMVNKIANRGTALFVNYYKTKLDLEMDIIATHCNGCKLNLQKLLDADEFNFAHDILGIRQHLNRKSGELEDCFSPRCSMPEAKPCKH